MSRVPSLIALAAAVAFAGVGVARGTYAAGGSDSSCYALMAEAFAAGKLQPTSALAAIAPWPDPSSTFTPGGFVPSESNPSASSPVCAPGFSVLLAAAIAVAGTNAMFWVTPLAGALLVWMSFVAARALSGPTAGAMAAVLIAASPPAIYQVVQPMNDVTTAALWMAVFASLITRRWTVAGICCGLALLVRPNLLPLAAVAGLFVLLARPIPNPQSLIRRVARFCIAAFPFGVAILLLNNALYGAPSRSGYGQLDQLFAVSHVPVNVPRYLRWLFDTHTAFPMLAMLAPVVVAREKRADVLLACGLIAATFGLYAFYVPFDDWSYLRFLLPAIALMLVLAAATTTTLLERVSGFLTAGALAKPLSRTVLQTAILAAITAALATFCIRQAHERHALALQFLEQRYRSAGIVVRDRLPEGAVVLSVWDSGAVRFHGRKEALTWEGLDPAWLDRALAWLDARGRRPYIMVESWEEEGFRRRFGTHSDIGTLDWPPKYEVDRVVRIYDPRDRPRHQRREYVETEYVWPVRDRAVKSKK